ncbi:alpha/beta fold hydrolase [Roseibium sp. SCP14]|uniref:alpha/beta fold hydrolase n=1 Tax=Roseibium sp. SCP14 TaxID=3141375 RepID=UPI00333BE85A
MPPAPQEALTGSEASNLPEDFKFNWKSPDGLTLAGRIWPPKVAVPEGNSRPIPVLCLPGLSRNTRDFNDIARYLQTRGHKVIALDYRGRGESDWDPDWRNYALPIEEKDIDTAIEQLDLERFALLGTSRGGLHALIMASKYSAERMAAVIFNDVGPHIEMRAIHRIAATLGRSMSNKSLEDVSANLERTLGHQFPAFKHNHWMKLAGQLASEREGMFVMDYDPALAHQLASLDDATPLPDLWHLYDRVEDRPVLIIHGEQSDLLSPETCQRMVNTHPNASLKTIAGQGHAPVLWEPETHEAIARFLKKIEVATF